jgi:hypothetical protein
MNWLSDTYTPWYTAVRLIAELDAVPFAAVRVAVGEAKVLVLVRERQPLVDTRTRAPMKSKGNAYLSGVLIYRFIILAIGFISFPPSFAAAVTYTTSVTQNVRP